MIETDAEVANFLLRTKMIGYVANVYQKLLRLKTEKDFIHQKDVTAKNLTNAHEMSISWGNLKK